MLKETQVKHIKALIAYGNIAEALEHLSKVSREANLLRYQFSGLQRDTYSGTLSDEESFIKQSRIAAATLDLLHDMERNWIDMSEPEPEVLLAYHQKDEGLAKKVQRCLRDSGINTPMGPRAQSVRGTATHDAHIGRMDAHILSAFVLNKAPLSSQFFLPIISINSLREGWTGLEQYLDIFSNSLTYPNTIPLSLDNVWRAPHFIQEEVEKLEIRLDEIDLKLHRSTKGGNDALVEQKANLSFQAVNLPKIVQRLKNARVVDLSDGRFEQGMSHVTSTILAALSRLEEAAPVPFVA